MTLLLPFLWAAGTECCNNTRDTSAQFHHCQPHTTVHCQSRRWLQRQWSGISATKESVRVEGWAQDRKYPKAWVGGMLMMYMLVCEVLVRIKHCCQTDKMSPLSKKQIHAKHSTWLLSALQIWVQSWSMDSALTFILALSFPKQGRNHPALFFGERWFYYSLAMTLHLLGKIVNIGQVKLQICCDMSPKAILPRVRNSPFLPLALKIKLQPSGVP